MLTSVTGLGGYAGSFYRYGCQRPERQYYIFVDSGLNLLVHLLGVWTRSAELNQGTVAAL